MQHKRVLTLAAIVVLVGVVTRAFAQAPTAQYADADATISRAGAVALMVEADPVLKQRLQVYIRRPMPLPLFDDIDEREWYVPYLETAFETGLITGNEQRTFRPGEALTEEEMIALGARFHAMTHAEMLAAFEQHTDSWFNGLVTASLQNGLRLPEPVRIGQPARRGDFYALLQSMNVQNPSQIALSYRVTAVTQQPSRPGTARPQNPGTGGQPSAPAAPQASAKAFAISLPTLGIKDLTITHPSDPFTKNGLLAPLKNGVGHLFSYPGKGGKILVYGHSSSYPGDISEYTKIFRQINKLNVGDLVSVTYGGTVHTYKVSFKETVPADDITAYAGGNGEELILYTCWPPDSIKERYLVHAVPVAN